MTSISMTDITARNIAIAEALGLNPKMIRKGGVTLTLDGELGPVLTVEYLTLDESVISKFAGTVARYKLVDLNDDGDAA